MLHVFLQKLGLNIDQVLERIITDFKPPIGEIEKPLKCLVFDSFYDNYKGAVSYVKVVEGSLKTGEEILFMATNKKFVVTEIRIFSSRKIYCSKRIKSRRSRIYCI
jgi:GTP-binding protein LepA